MFRFKDRLLQEKRTAKKEKSNKEYKPKSRIKDFSNPYVLNEDKKALQIALSNELGVKVHKNDLRSVYSTCNSKYYDLDTKPEIFFAPNEKVGNTTNLELAEAINTIQHCYQHKIPLDTKTKHDITKWTTSKYKDKERQKQRKDKLNFQNNIL